jgi:hypothetical protein
MPAARWTLALIFLAVSATSAFAEAWTFEEAPTGQLPPGWTVAKTGIGPGSVWEVQEDPSAPASPKVLVQVSDEGPRPLFNLCVTHRTNYADLELTVAVKALHGKIDQGGGPVWRYQDENNYYIARLNPLEQNYRVYKVIDGKRTQLATADVDGDDALAGRWHTLRVVHQETKIRCYLNGQLLLEAEDDAISKPGAIGLWTKADAVTAFDALKVSRPSDEDSE